jgi:hypothetical protein
LRRVGGVDRGIAMLLEVDVVAVEDSLWRVLDVIAAPPDVTTTMTREVVVLVGLVDVGVVVDVLSVVGVGIDELVVEVGVVEVVELVVEVLEKLVVEEVELVDVVDVDVLELVVVVEDVELVLVDELVVELVEVVDVALDVVLDVFVVEEVVEEEPELVNDPELADDAEPELPLELLDAEASKGSNARPPGPTEIVTRTVPTPPPKTPVSFPLKVAVI